MDKRITYGVILVGFVLGVHTRQIKTLRRSNRAIINATQQIINTLEEGNKQAQLDAAFQFIADNYDR